MTLLPKGQLRRIARRIADILEAAAPFDATPGQPIDVTDHLPGGLRHGEEVDVILERLRQLGWDCVATTNLAYGARESAMASRKQRRQEAATGMQKRLGDQIAGDLIAPRRRKVYMHIGPTNSGKTHRALQRLAEARKGLYLAPLRLLAWEAADRLNEAGCPTDLLTGEEYIPAPEARVVAATTEMFPPGSYEVVVIDEAQMVGDPDRGWAWLRALVRADAVELHVCAAPQSTQFLHMLFASLGDEVTISHYERLAPLQPLPRPFKLTNLPPRSAVVAFSRSAVLRLKGEIEAAHKQPCAVIYGALPPDVRREQARRVRDGECPYVVATDAIGMGINFPVDYVFLFETAKFDGVMERPLRPAEVLQIIGRAGRYGLSETGYYGALSRENHEALLETAAQAPPQVQFAYLQPTVEQLELLSGRLAKRLQLWQTLAEPRLPPHVRIAPLESMIELAKLLPPALEDDLGEAYMLVTAPVSKEGLAYWKQVTTALANGRKAPAPEPVEGAIRSDGELLEAEAALRQHELCLWLIRRGVPCVASERRIRGIRNRIADAINEGLSRGLTLGGCRVCGKKLAPGYPYRICQSCYEDRPRGRSF